VAAARKRKQKQVADWSWRLAGIAICAFFALGVITGLSESGRKFALRCEALLDLLPHHGRSALISSIFNPAKTNPQPHPQRAEGAVALVERSDGFYALDSRGELRGPVMPASQGDLPILSGGAAESGSGADLVQYAEILVRAEVELGEAVSEMSVGKDGESTLFLEQPRIGLAVNTGNATSELAHGARVLSIWRGHNDLIAGIDLTAPGQAVVRLKPAAAESLRKAELRETREAASSSMPSPTSQEVTAIR
jgi:hypothetical protein